MHPGDLAWGFSDHEMIWLLCCDGAATVGDNFANNCGHSSTAGDRALRKLGLPTPAFGGLAPTSPSFTRDLPE